MTRRTPVLFGALVLALATVYAWVRPSGGTQQSPVARRPLSCRFAAGEELAFHVRASSSAQASESASSQQLRLEATMWWRVLEERSATGWVIAATLTDVQLLEGGAAEVEPARRAALESPFLVQIGRDCRFGDFAFAPSVDVEARRQLQGMLQSSEVILPPLGRAQWVSRHKDSLGAFDATYTLDAAASDEAPSFTRTHARYIASTLPLLPPQLGGRMRVDVLSAETRATLDAKGRWVGTLGGAEHLKVWMGSRLLSDVTSEVQVERLDGVSGAPTVLAGLDAERFAWGSAPAGATRASDLPAAPEPALAALTLDAALADFTKRLGAGPNGLHDATSRLASYLSVHPEAIANVIAGMRGGTLPEPIHAALFLALEKTGTLAAESGLAAALKDRGLNTQDRMRAAVALQDVPRPTERTAKALIDQSRGLRTDAEERQVADASLLALGALSHRTDTRQPELSQLAHEELDTRLRTARETEDLAVALDAIGNAGDERFADTLRTHASDESPLVRAHAARAWRRMEPETMEPVLVEWLGQEQDAQVRRAIADTLAEQVREQDRAASQAVLAAAAARLATESDARTRSALISVLGSAASTDASARLALVQQFHRETVPDLQVLIGRYVRAEELR
ncbi:HEAT repeat domain-containing protein [Pyxidicoccus parkwayensis]|uniref:HEAT repeat domain-containing protein n=1 Tax=Pyxidicoccus parkwayensis TaxID=2813578 RepID=A0ABX7P6P1_9BACT|nr:HEAT repeat domain-containing protein [Pyxidicoccus parkwaysis]QSQ26117.1 HEAT repeat domain-containing protein [Pyxidicoccus parkwaysis]